MRRSAEVVYREATLRTHPSSGQGTPGAQNEADQTQEDGATTEDSEDLPRRTKLRIKLGDGKERSLQHMLITSFWHPDGTPMSSQQFIALLYGQLPEFVRDEAELRALWSAPDTRTKLLQGLAEKGFGADQLAEMQSIISAENGDRFDVLAQDKLAPLLSLRYHNSIADAVADLGKPEEIGQLFANFQRYLYEPQSAA